MVTLFRHHFHLTTLLQAMLEACLFFGLVYFSVRVLPHGSLSPAPSAVMPALVFAAAMVCVSSAFGLYRHDQPLGVTAVAPRFLVSLLIALPIAYAVFTVFPQQYPVNDAITVGALMGLVGVFAFRRAMVPGLQAGLAPHRALVVGTGGAAAAVERTLRESPLAGVQVVGFFPVRPAEPTQVGESRILRRFGSVAEAARALRVDEVIVAVREQRGGVLPMDDLLSCRLSGVRVTNLVGFMERVKGIVPLESLKASWLIYGDGFRQGRLRAIVKRAFDVVVSAALLAAAAPVMVLAALAVLWESPGPVIYRQTRVGRAGATFELLKFRSMRADAEGDGRPRWATANDDRVTFVGRLLRRTRIDELPQLINVLKGEMSFVGPRPERPYFVAQLGESIPFYALRLSMKPGITGWAQVRHVYTASVEDTAKKLEYDLYYVKNHSLFLDLMILFETVRVVLFGEGAR
ncbi:MAG: TIGR03013 family XrtA/PEP-CTERM system glycosyltransferase [Burkholderiales bacterium]